MNLFSGSEVPSLCLRDMRRTEAFGEAIRRLVKAGDVVVDAGSGSGILALFAAQAGASKVFAIEHREGLAGFIRKNAEANGFSHVIEVLSGDARAAAIPGPVDLVVAEMIDTWLVDEHQVPVINALHRSGVVGPSTRIVPDRYEAFATLGASEFNYFGFHLPFLIHDWPDLEEAAGWHPTGFQALSATQQIFEVDFSRPIEGRFRREADFLLPLGGIVSAVQLSGRVHLASGLSLGATVAFNGDKIVPVDSFEANPNESVHLVFEGEFGGGGLETLTCELACRQ